MKIKKEYLKNIIPKFKKQRILVIGDLILDHYIMGRVERISPEAPVPVVWAREERYLGGGAANVAFNIIDLGAKADICGVVGDDYWGKIMLDLVRKRGVGSELLIKEDNRPTTIKTRIIAQHQQVARVDWETTDEVSLRTNYKLLDKVKKNIYKYNAVIIEDYGKGVINSFLVKEVVKICKGKKKIITVDPKEDHFNYYKGITALTPNLKEAQVCAGMRIKKKKQINLLGKKIIQKLSPQALLITLGEEGMRLFVKKDKGKSYYMPTTAHEVFDVTGAGDTVIAVFTLVLSTGASFLEAAVISNICAGIVVAKLGAATVTAQELLNLLEDYNKSIEVR